MPAFEPRRRSGRRDLTALEEAQEDLRVFVALRSHYSGVADHLNIEKLNALRTEVAALEAEIARLVDEVERAPAETVRYIEKCDEQLKLVQALRADPRAVVYTKGGKKKIAKGDSRKAKALRLRRQLKALEEELAEEEIG